MYASSLQPKVIMSEYMNLKFAFGVPESTLEVLKPQYKKEWTQYQCGLLGINTKIRIVTEPVAVTKICYNLLQLIEFH